MRALVILALTLFLVGSAAADAPKVAASSAFTYQGQLIDNDVPSNEAADLRFRLYDAASGGSQVGSTVDRLAVQVVNGIFTVDLDFGLSAFDGDARWLQIDVRSPAGSGSYVALTPRQELTAVPYALRALSGGGGGGGQWSLVGGSLVNDNAPGFVGINRSDRVTSNEYFGIQAPVGDGTYGGMYIRTDGAEALPFYGYRTATRSAWTYLNGPDGSWRIFNGGDRLSILNDGNVGIGTTAPDSRLSVAGLIESTTGGFKFPDGTIQTTAGGGGGSGSQIILNDGTTTTFEAFADDPVSTVGGSVVNMYDAAGLKTVEIDGSDTGGGNYSMWNAAGIRTVRLLSDYASGSGSLLELDQSDGSAGVRILGHGGFGTTDRGGEIQINDAAGNRAITISANYGGGTESRIVVDVLEITGGADLSEQFDVRSDDDVIEPGSVVSIDPAAAGDLRVSARAYDRRVAGIISGAGGVRPGMLMGQRGSEADGQHPVALTGRVYCKVDASYGAIEPGDLLTTSDTPGHAMKVTDHARATGAILGKAMTALESGRGQVLVLVSLQ